MYFMSLADREEVQDFSMKKNIYSQKDLLAGFYNPIMTSEVEPEAFAKNVERSIKLCKDPAKLAAIHDCELVHLGVFDDETGKIEAFENEVSLLNCKDLIEAIEHGS